MQRESKARANGWWERGGRPYEVGSRARAAGLVVEEEVPVDGDLVAALRAPAEAERAFPVFAAACLGLAAVDVPHAERDRARGLHHDLVLAPWSVQRERKRERTTAAAALLAARTPVGDIDLSEAVCGVLGHRHDGWAARLREADVAHDPVCEARGEGDLLARGRAVDVALEV